MTTVQLIEQTQPVEVSTRCSFTLSTAKLHAAKCHPGYDSETRSVHCSPSSKIAARWKYFGAVVTGGLEHSTCTERHNRPKVADHNRLHNKPCLSALLHVYSSLPSESNNADGRDDVVLWKPAQPGCAHKHIVHSTTARVTDRLPSHLGSNTTSRRAASCVEMGTGHVKPVCRSQALPS